MTRAFLIAFSVLLTAPAWAAEPQPNPPPALPREPVRAVALGASDSAVFGSANNTFEVMPYNPNNAPPAAQAPQPAAPAPNGLAQIAQVNPLCADITGRYAQALQMTLQPPKGFSREGNIAATTLVGEYHRLHERLGCPPVQILSVLNRFATVAR